MPTVREIERTTRKLPADANFWKFQIEKANKLLQLPQSAAVRRKMLIENVIEERNRQLLYKEKLLQNWKRQEQTLVDFQKQQREKWKAEEELEIQKRKECLEALNEARLKQLEEHRLQFLREKEEKACEREKLQHEAEQEQKEAELKEQLRRKLAHDFQHDLIESIKEHQARKVEDNFFENGSILIKSHVKLNIKRGGCEQQSN